MIIDRRRFISITAASAVFPGAASSGTLHRQTGRALGAATSMQLANTSADKARDAFAIVEAELSRLERVFSLYDPGSELSRLNANGYLAAAAPELVSVLSLCAGLHHATDGAFDPTVQPLWAHHAGLSKGSRPQDLVGWDMVTVTRDDIRFAKPGMQLTLNGIAQGYITDQIAALLRRRGFRQVLIDMGEIAAIGQKTDQQKWSVGISTPDKRIVGRVQLKDRALATSAPGAMMLDQDRRTGHILNPRGTADAPLNELVSISSPSAALADGLSTAGCLMPKRQLLGVLQRYSSTTLEAFV